MCLCRGERWGRGEQGDKTALSNGTLFHGRRDFLQRDSNSGLPVQQASGANSFLLELILTAPTMKMAEFPPQKVYPFAIISLVRIHVSKSSNKDSEKNLNI